MEDSKVIFIILLFAVIYSFVLTLGSSSGNSELTPSVQNPFLENTNFAYIR